MCEWLSCREWCDVQLLCNGRTFSAHRAVLASVSAFLRQLFLSSPIEDETPTFIVLPDFDFEAMSSVLYYIYNGEVVIQKEKLDRFLDIIKAMEIFIDAQYLPKVCKNMVYSSNNYPKLTILKRTKIFSLEDETQIDTKFVNVKKGEQIQNLLLQYSTNGLDFLDKRPSCKLWRDRRELCLSKQSPCGDLKRNPFLRDLFMETYPRNGNANGLTEGVLAISNEHYRGPTSVLLTNANGKHLRVDDTLSETAKTEYTSQLPSSFHPWHKVNTLNDGVNPEGYMDTKILNTTDLNLKLLFEKYGIPKSSAKTDSWMSRWPNPTLITEAVTNKHISSYLDLSMIESSSSTKTNPFVQTAFINKQSFGTINNSFGKNVIFNQVLESPWCSKRPNNYKPFRKKVNMQNSILNKEGDVNSVNDSNNNIHMSTLSRSEDVIIEGNSSEASPVQSNSPDTIHPVEPDDKSTICNQVPTVDFISPLTTTRRPSSVPRYTCGECAKSFSQLRNFKYHMSVHRGTREFAATCTVCGKYFNDRGYLSSHMKIHRNRKEYKCSQCPKSFNQRVAYNMHVRIHTGVKPHVCAECGKAFSRKMLLKQHQRTHSGERPYACPHCDKRFADRSNMTLHLRLHTGVKPFSCSLCPKSFTKKHHLKSHLNFHTGAKPYACPRCKLAFTQSSNMRTHLKKCSASETNTSSAT